ncbi:putative gamma-glutamylcyclotransferase CG2811 [Sitodiplosis mosellana]|uniref:putative gamma-glutamylcyclotransferase CG2811 n=1 Tax=Sitodiplosis mosellana TaxID=263140 RepID=UPI0024440B3C|nr:putative gamma-glutamylcyclotransferase CG2811 [Sitodiplosis mosellana]
MNSTQQLIQVFVYGTLKRGEPNHHWLTNKENGFAQFVSSGKTDTQFPLIVATKYNIPFLLNIPATGHSINGEIYSVDGTMLRNLDELEDYPELYDRNIFTINGSDGKSHQCWIYMLKRFPDDFLNKYKFLSEYRNSVEQPYRETYLDTCTPDDLYTS